MATKTPILGKEGRYHHGDLRKALLEAARQTLEANGVEGLTLRDVARRAGVSSGAPYRHFADRAALVAAIAEDGFRELGAEMKKAARAARTRGEDAGGELVALGVGYVRFALRRPTQYRIMFTVEVADKSRFPDLQTAADAAFGQLECAVVACQRAGLVVDIDPRLVATGAWSLVHGFASLSLEGQVGAKLEGAGNPAAIAAKLSSMLYLGIAPRP